jgi:hypothetical protein
MMTPAPGHGRLRASHADREQVVDVLKTAFVQGRLTQDELDVRVGQALAARTYAELAALTADLPSGPDRATPPSPAAAPSPEVVPSPAAAPAPARARNRSANMAVKSGAGAIGAVILVVSGTVLALGQPVAAAAALAMFITVLAAVAAGFVAALIAMAVKIESRHQNRSRGQLPPGPASGASGASGPARPRPSSADPARTHRRRPPESLVVWPAS